MNLVTINNVTITLPEHEGTVLVPIKPICEVLGIDAKSQRESIQNHPILSSVGVQNPSTGSDGKTYEMFCLPQKYIFGWLFMIDARKVKPEAADKVIEYQHKVFDVLHEKFYKEPQLQKEKLIKVLEKENEIMKLEEYRKEINSKIKKAKDELEEIKYSDPTQLQLEI